MNCQIYLLVLFMEDILNVVLDGYICPVKMRLALQKKKTFGLCRVTQIERK